MPTILSKLLPASIASWLSHPRIKTFRNFLVTYFVIKLGVYVLVSLYDRGLSLFLKEQKVLFLRKVFRFLRPLYSSQVNQQSKETIKKIQQEFVLDTQVEKFPSLPKAGLKEADIITSMEILSKERESRWKDGKASGSVYSGSDSLTDLTTNAYRLFCWSNPLHPDLFPGLRKMEAEVVSMVLNMYNAGKDCCGTVTSGGTESILLAVKACRDYAEAELGITSPELVVPVTAHAAFDKAASYFKIHIIHCPVNEKTGQVDTAYVRRVVTRNTILIVGSAPGFPHGIIDDIEELARIARRIKRPLHVDCCLGGFLLPFMEKANFPLPPFDFRVQGVTSISCDTHKYGFAPKGSSVIMYSSNNLRKYQYFVQPDWPGGIYASPTLAGSRPGALVAGCWATMLNIGEEGYIKATREIITAARKIDSELRKIPGIFVCGNPLVSVVGFGAKDFNILSLSDELAKKGWNLNPLQYPPSVHICVTHLTVKVADQFIEDVRTVAAVLLKNPPKNSGTAAIYGLAQSVPDRSIVNHMAGCYLDALYIP